MSAQAEEMKAMVSALVALVKGQRRGTVQAISTAAPSSHTPLYSRGVARPAITNGKTPAVNPSTEITPKQVIPLGDDFEDI